MGEKSHFRSVNRKTKWLQWRERMRARRQRLLSQTPPDLSEAGESRCLNCGTVFKGYYCPGCGQSADTHRFTVKQACMNLFEAIFGGDSIILTTCGNLFYRPGKMIRDFILGSRTRYFRPVQLLLCLVTLYALIAFFLGIPNASTPTLSSDVQAIDENKLRKGGELLYKIINNKVIFGLLFSFFCVFPFKLVFRKCTLERPDGTVEGLNVAEHFYTLVYITCQFLLVGLFFELFRNIKPIYDLQEHINDLLLILLPTWTYQQVFGIRWLKSLGKSLIAGVLVLLESLLILLLYFGFYYGIASLL